MKTQKVYTFPDRQFYGEYDYIDFINLKTKIVKGEITEQLCLIDSNDRAHCFDDTGVLDEYSPEFLDAKTHDLIIQLLKLQMTKRIGKLNEDKKQLGL